MSGRIEDVGGGAGIPREFLVRDEFEFVSTDSWLASPFYYFQGNKKEAYSCLNNPLNFITATVEFLPFVNEIFDWVHTRSMLDHLQGVDLALLEARRVLKPNGHLLIGLCVEGGKSSVISLSHKIKDGINDTLQIVGIDRWKDHHIWHPTYSA
jgi:ubiquinone/menaquinone biosynthesis C-methylase UbiE